MNGNLLGGIALIIGGALCLYWGIWQKHTMSGLKFRLILAGIAGIGTGLILVFN